MDRGIIPPEISQFYSNPVDTGRERLRYRFVFSFFKATGICFLADNDRVRIAYPPLTINVKTFYTVQVPFIK